MLAQAGAGEGTRTPDPLITNQMLYQLSYASHCKLLIIDDRNSHCKNKSYKGVCDINVTLWVTSSFGVCF